MILLSVIIIALFAHYIADFPMQAINKRIMGRKNESNLHLFNHVWIYSLVFGLILSLGVGLLAVPLALINGALHFVIDYFTSRGSHACHRRGVSVTHWLTDNTVVYNQKWMGPFWCIIGFDQFLHNVVMFICLFAFGVL